MTVSEYKSKSIQYYGIIGDAKGRIVEVLITRRDGKTVATQETGKRYKSMAVAMLGLEQKNASLARPEGLARK